MMVDDARILYERKNIFNIDGYQMPAVLSEATTLRDQFAMAALPALISLHRADLRWKDCAPEAYRLADAMLKAREAK